MATIHCACSFVQIYLKLCRHEAWVGGGTQIWQNANKFQFNLPCQLLRTYTEYLPPNKINAQKHNYILDPFFNVRESAYVCVCRPHLPQNKTRHGVNFSIKTFHNIFPFHEDINPFWHTILIEKAYKLNNDKDCMYEYKDSHAAPWWFLWYVVGGKTFISDRKLVHIKMCKINVIFSAVENLLAHQ